MIKWNEYTWYSRTAALVFFILVLPAWMFYLGTKYQEVQDLPTAADYTNDTPATVAPRSPATFTWIYAPDSSVRTPDGNPQTNIFLEVSYADGSSEYQLVGYTHATCNDLPDVEPDTVPNSTNILCYGAGLGYRFKITKGEDSYLVQRKTIEEASLEYNPPQAEYVVVAEFPL